MQRATALLIVTLSMAAPPPAPAQQGAAEVRGRVLDPHGGLLPRTTVVLRNQETGMFRRVVSNPDGVYFLSGVTPGVYELSVERTGFKRYSRRGVRLEVGRTATVDIGLEMGGLDEQLTVTAETPIVDVTSKEVGGHITSGELTDLPSLNRSFVGFVALLPGVITTTDPGSFTADSIIANGQSPRNKNFLLRQGSSMCRWGPNGPGRGHAGTLAWLAEGFWGGRKPLTHEFRDRGRGFNVLSVDMTSMPAYGSAACPRLHAG